MLVRAPALVMRSVELVWMVPPVELKLPEPVTEVPPEMAPERLMDVPAEMAPERLSDVMLVRAPALVMRSVELVWMVPPVELKLPDPATEVPPEMAPERLRLVPPL